jgi:hypothetical protein
MIVLYTDFGPGGPYLGQMRGVLCAAAPAVPVVDLMSDVPAFNPRAAAYLLAALAVEFPAQTVFLCVVDPGVGSASRLPVAVEIDGQWFVGPDNGLFNVLARRGQSAVWWEITWRPARLSHTFHGRDLFAPVAAAIARGEAVPGQRLAKVPPPPEEWPADLGEVIYIDHFGNAMTGIRAGVLGAKSRLLIGGVEVARKQTYAEGEEGQPFWYENSSGLAEIAVNRGSAAGQLGLHVGTPVTTLPP